jgi:hypothetical protein
VSVRREFAGAVQLITRELSQFTVTSDCRFLQGGDVFCRAQKLCVTLGFPLDASINLWTLRNKRTAYFCYRAKEESALLLNVSTYARTRDVIHCRTINLEN